MVKRATLLWSWALVGVPTACGLVARFEAPAYFSGSLPALATNAPPAVCVLSGLIAAHYAIRAGAGWTRRVLFYVAYAGGMFCVCVLIGAIATMGYANM